jgi:hypothetical protein
VETREHPPPALVPVREIETAGVSTVRGEDLVTSPYSAEIVTAVVPGTAEVVTENVALALPPGTVTLAGTVATEGLPLDRDTTAPPPGAGPFSVTVPVEPLPPNTEDGARERDDCEGGSTVRLADLVTPPYSAEIVAAVELGTATVVTEKVALALPPGTVTLAGTVATEGLPLDRDTTAPPPGAGPFSVTVPVEPLPPNTVAGLRETDAGEGGSTVRLADLVTPPYSAEIVAAVELGTAEVVTENVALVLPSGTVTLAGTVATEGLPLDRDTTAPPPGAGPFSVTVPVEPLPPNTEDGFKDRETSAGRMSKRIAFEVPPPGGGLYTVTLAVPAVAMSPAGMAARTSVLETKLVVRSEPFHRTLAPETNLLPSTVSVKEGAPAICHDGLRPMTAGWGARTSNVIALERLPSGLNTVTGIVPGVARSADVIGAVS